MKNIFAGVLLSFILLSQMQIMQVYAQDQVQLENEKQKGEQVLDALEGVIDTAVEKLDDKITDIKQSQKLEEKHEEIGEYLEKIEEEIREGNSEEDIKELVEEAKKVVVLKVVS
jgi:peptidoglycan hydrolase CwlO-like protein